MGCCLIIHMTNRGSLGGLAGCIGAQAYPGPGAYPYAIPSPDMPIPIPPTQDRAPDSDKGCEQEVHFNTSTRCDAHFESLNLSGHAQSSLHPGSQSQSCSLSTSCACYRSFWQLTDDRSEVLLHWGHAKACYTQQPFLSASPKGGVVIQQCTMYTCKCKSP